MGKHAKVLLITLSVALNVAFVGVWLVHAMSSPSGMPQAYPGPDTRYPIWCPLHRELNVTLEQWQQIEPRLKEFRATADSITGEVQGLRTEVVDLLAGPHPDRQAVEAKQDEILTAQRRMQRLVAKHLLGEKEILTADQQQQLFAIIRNRLGGNQTTGPLLVPGKAAEGGIGKILRDSGRSGADRPAEDETNR